MAVRVQKRKILLDRCLSLEKYPFLPLKFRFPRYRFWAHVTFVQQWYKKQSFVFSFIRNFVLKKHKCHMLDPRARKMYGVCTYILIILHEGEKLASHFGRFDFWGTASVPIEYEGSWEWELVRKRWKWEKYFIVPEADIWSPSPYVITKETKGWWLVLYILCAFYRFSLREFCDLCLAYFLHSCLRL